MSEAVQSADDRSAWLDQIARAAQPYLGCPQRPDGQFVRLEMPDGTAMSVRARDWDEVARRAREMG